MTGSSTSGSIGLGFAIPINLAKNISGQLIATGSAEHAYLGVSLVNGSATADGVTRRGALVEVVTPGSPAATAGIQVDDVIVAINGSATNGSESLTAFVRQFSAGDVVALTVVRDGQAIEITATLAVRDDAALQQQQQPQQGQGGLGQGGSGQGGTQPGSGQGDSGQGDSGQGSDNNPFGWLFPGGGSNSGDGN
jgi:putative serine protease PepD